MFRNKGAVYAKKSLKLYKWIKLTLYKVVQYLIKFVLVFLNYEIKGTFIHNCLLSIV